MPIDYKQITKAISKLAADKNIKVTLNESAKGAAFCGVCSFIGGLLLGPVGLAIGGTAGSVVAYNMTKGTFRPLADVINGLSETQKKELADSVIKAVQDAHFIDFIQLLMFITSNNLVQQTVIKVVTDFVFKELRAEVKSG